MRIGFSAYLKLICLNPAPQLTELKKRLEDVTTGYDYYRNLRRGIKRCLKGEDSAEIFASFEKIKRTPEREDTKAAFQKFLNWKEAWTVSAVVLPSLAYTSPTGAFKITYEPDFCIDVGGTVVGIHVWNTRKPKLVPNFVYATLAIFQSLYDDGEDTECDLAVLSLRDGVLYRHSDMPGMAVLGEQIVEMLEGQLNKAIVEKGHILPAGIAAHA